MIADYQFVPKLCDYFTEIAGVEAPKRPDQGWLISINGQRDGHRIIDVSSKPLIQLAIALTTLGAIGYQWNDRSVGEWK